MTSVETSAEAFERTKSFAEGAVFGCRECNSQCTLWWLARVESHEEMIKLLRTPAVSSGTVGEQSPQQTT